MIIHKDLAEGRWFEFSLWSSLQTLVVMLKGPYDGSEKADLIIASRHLSERWNFLYFTLADPKNKKQLRELCRAREALVDHFVYDNIYRSTEESWQHYFFAFNYAAAIQRGR